VAVRPSESLDEGDLVVGQPVELIYQPVDLCIERDDLALKMPSVLRKVDVPESPTK